MKITAVLQYMFITEVVVNIDNKFGTNCWDFHWISGVLVVHVSNIFQKLFGTFGTKRHGVYISTRIFFGIPMEFLTEFFRVVPNFLSVGKGHLVLV